MSSSQKVIYHFKGVNIYVKISDLTEETTEAIVCPANSYNHMRGGVAGVIRSKGGDEIEREAMSKAPVPIGKAVSTTAGKLKSKYVIHSPTMKEPVETCDINKIKLATSAALNCANRKKIETISLPGMGTGTGCVLLEDAALAMVSEMKSFLSKKNKFLNQINLVSLSKRLHEEIINACNQLL